jgi:hypothetical protein
MAGFVPAIRVFLQQSKARDGRDTLGHEGKRPIIAKVV